MSAELQKNDPHADAAHIEESHAPEAHKHPPYLWVFFWLTILTIIEVTPIFYEIFFHEQLIAHNIWVPILLLLALMKSTLVAMYYMHLKYDQPWLVAVIMIPFAFAMFFGFAILAGYFQPF